MIGIVNIHAESDIPSNPLIVRLTCKESVFSEERHEKETLIVHYPVGHLEGVQNQGMYSIPFNLRLPSDLFPSFKHDQLECGGKIKYYLDAFLEGSSKVGSHKTITWVYSTLNSIVDVPPVSEQRTFYIRNCFRTTGTSVAYADVNLSRSVVDNDLLVSVRVDNKKIGHIISKVRCSLIRYMGVKFKVPCRISRELFQEKICSESNRVKIPTG